MCSNMLLTKSLLISTIDCMNMKEWVVTLEDEAATVKLGCIQCNGDK